MTAQQPDDPLAAHQIAGLTALEAAISIAARALVITYPSVNRVPRPDDPPELRTARDLVDDCERLCFALDAHRHEIRRQVRVRVRPNLADDRSF